MDFTSAFSWGPRYPGIEQSYVGQQQQPPPPYNFAMAPNEIEAVRQQHQQMLPLLSPYPNAASPGSNVNGLGFAQNCQTNLDSYLSNPQPQSHMQQPNHVQRPDFSQPYYFGPNGMPPQSHMGNPGMNYSPDMGPFRAVLGDSTRCNAGTNQSGSLPWKGYVSQNQITPPPLFNNQMRHQAPPFNTYNVNISNHIDLSSSQAIFQPSVRPDHMIRTHRPANPINHTNQSLFRPQPSMQPIQPKFAPIVIKPKSDASAIIEAQLLSDILPKNNNKMSHRQSLKLENSGKDFIPTSEKNVIVVEPQKKSVRSEGNRMSSSRVFKTKEIDVADIVKGLLERSSVKTKHRAITPKPTKAASSSASIAVPTNAGSSSVLIAIPDNVGSSSVPISTDVGSSSVHIAIPTHIGSSSVPIPSKDRTTTTAISQCSKEVSSTMAVEIQLREALDGIQQSKQSKPPRTKTPNAGHSIEQSLPSVEQSLLTNSLPTNSTSNEVQPAPSASMVPEYVLLPDIVLPEEPRENSTDVSPSKTSEKGSSHVEGRLKTRKEWKAKKHNGQVPVSPPPRPVLIKPKPFNSPILTVSNLPVPVEAFNSLIPTVNFQASVKQTVNSPASVKERTRSQEHMLTDACLLAAHDIERCSVVLRRVNMDGKSSISIADHPEFQHILKQGKHQPTKSTKKKKVPTATLR